MIATRKMSQYLLLCFVICLALGKSEGSGEYVENIGLNVIPSPGYDYYPNLGYYKFHNAKRTWKEAKTICELEGAHLAIIKSNDEFLILKELKAAFTSNSGEWVNVGFSDLEKEGDWVTVLKQPIAKTGYNKWQSGYPKSTKGWNCGDINASNGEQANWDCTLELPFLCERKV